MQLAGGEVVGLLAEDREIGPLRQPDVPEPKVAADGIDRRGVAFEVFEVVDPDEAVDHGGAVEERDPAQAQADQAVGQVGGRELGAVVGDDGLEHGNSSGTAWVRAANGAAGLVVGGRGRSAHIRLRVGPRPGAALTA